MKKKVITLITVLIIGIGSIYKVDTIVKNRRSERIDILIEQLFIEEGE